MIPCRLVLYGCWKRGGRYQISRCKTSLEHSHFPVKCPQRHTVPHTTGKVQCVIHKFEVSSITTFVTVMLYMISCSYMLSHEAIWQWSSLVTSSLVKIIAISPHSWQQKIDIHGNPCIILYYYRLCYNDVWHDYWSSSNLLSRTHWHLEKYYSNFESTFFLMYFTLDNKNISMEKEFNCKIMISQHWIRQWLVAWWQQAIAWTNVDLNLQYHITPTGHNELIHYSIHYELWISQRYFFLQNTHNGHPIAH